MVSKLLPVVKTKVGVPTEILTDGRDRWMTQDSRGWWLRYIHTLKGRLLIIHVRI